MFEQAVQVSEAMQQRYGAATLVPALCGCRRCQSAQMIASPVLGVCNDCGAALAVLGGEAPQSAHKRKPPTRAA
jgi:hypothetical protein